MGKAVPLMIQGTHSDAGKSAIVTALCRIFAQDGYKTAPFKSQNMALNSYITLDGKEIGRAQGVQAEAAGVIATTDMNPILIKPNREHEAQIVVHGKPYANMKAVGYRTEFYDKGLNLITEAYNRLAEKYERVIIEGAGSPAEINLNDRELVNMIVARIAKAPVIIVGDIDKGGVFASLVGTLQLLEPQDRDRVIGVIINKFRGDLSLLEPGLDWFKQYTGKPVLGVIPYIPNLNIEAEDSVVLSRYSTAQNQTKEIDIAVVRHPMISNFTDIDPFAVEPDCHLRFVEHADELGEPDLLILPGSKNTIEDFMLLQQNGLAGQILKLHQTGRTYIFGICGGYQMMGERIEDPFAIESPCKEVQGLSLFPLQTVITQEKETVRSEGILHFMGMAIDVTGFEIHMGRSIHVHPCESLIQMGGRMEGSKNERERLFGTYFHGIFHNDSFRAVLLNAIRSSKGLPPKEDRPSYHLLREKAFERLADRVRSHIDLVYINEKMKEFQRKGKG